MLGLSNQASTQEDQFLESFIKEKELSSLFVCYGDYFYRSLVLFSYYSKST